MLYNMLLRHESEDTMATATVPMAQINVRIERPSKEAGDEALARAGLTPSQVVRELWQNLADQESPEDAIALTERRVHEATAVREPSPIEGRLFALDRMYDRFDRFGETWGLDLSALPDDSEEDLRASVRSEKQAARAYGDTL